MFALIYDEYDPAHREKKIVSIHKSRPEAEKALAKRQIELGKRVWECNTRIVWLAESANAGNTITPDMFDTWAPDEEIPTGDQVPDGD